MPIVREQGLPDKQRPAGPHPRSSSAPPNLTEDRIMEAKGAQGPAAYGPDEVSRYKKGGGVKGFAKGGTVSSGVKPRYKGKTHK